MTPEILQEMPIEQRLKLFTQWLGNQPEGAEYTFANCERCAMCQFAATFKPEHTFAISAGSHHVSFLVRGVKVRVVDIRLIPTSLSGDAQYALHANVFGRAYDRLANACGLPRRATRRAVLCRWLARFSKRKHALAA